MYHFTGIQHTTNAPSEVVIPTENFDTLDAAKYRFHEEWNYTYASEERLGLDTLIFDDQGVVVFQDKYVKAKPAQTETAPAEA